MADSRERSELKRFLAEIDPYVQQPYGVMLVPEFDPFTIAFDRNLPDRLMCGRAVFDDMRRRGVREKVMPEGYHAIMVGKA